jgi:hypothetical protein
LTNRGGQGVTLTPNLWEEDKKISVLENLALELTCTPKELDEVLLSMKSDSMPSADGLPVLFFKRFCGILRGHML